MTYKTTISINDEEVAEMFRRRRDTRDVTSAEYLQFLMKEASVNRTRKELLKQTEQLNERLASDMRNGGDDACDSL